MNYEAAERYVFSLTDYEKTPGVVYTSTTYDLGRVERLLHLAGDPHLKARSAHVAGTKGKGSTTAMIASVLTECGYRTGLYTSPHFHTLRERIRVDGKMITEKEFASAVETLVPFVEQVNADAGGGPLTTFEVLTAAAFLHFSEKKVGYQTLEVGLGGRLDATNVVSPDVCVITSISLDHTEVLGNTVELIAGEKAGIIKPGVPVVSASQVDVVDRVIAATCRDRGSRLIRAGEDVRWELISFDDHGQDFRVTSAAGDYALRVPLLGEHQLENAACAMAALEVLAGKGARLTPEEIARGFATVRWPGRLQVLSREPLLVCDGAHNADSAAKLRESLRRYFGSRRAVLLFAASADKDIAGMARELAPAFSRAVVTRSNHPRSADPRVLMRAFAEHGLAAEMRDGSAAALERALELAGPSDLVCVTGSLFVVGEVLARWGLRR